MVPVFTISKSSAVLTILLSIIKLLLDIKSICNFSNFEFFLFQN